MRSPNNSKPVRRKCQCGCKQPATQTNGVTAWATPECAMKIAKARQDKAKQKKAKEERKVLREAKANLKTWRQWRKEAQDAFNAFIRARDSDKPCISCGAHPNHIPFGSWVIGGGWDAGHYLSVAMRPELRFHEDNVHKQCKKCNGGAGRNSGKRHEVDAAYREGLIARIGLERVEWLEGKHEPAHYTIPDLQEIKRKYSRMAKELKKGRTDNGYC